MVNLSILGTFWWPRHENAQNDASVNFPGPFGDQGLTILKLSLLSLQGPFGGHDTKMLKMASLEAAWGHFVAKARKCSN